MFCLIDTNEVPDTGNFRRLMCGVHGYKGVRVYRCTVLSMSAMCVTIDITPKMNSKTVQKRILWAAGLMRERRVGRVLFSKSFPYKELVLREGFDEIDDSPLMELLAGRLIATAASGKNYAAIFARRIIGPVERALTELCTYFRYVSIVTDSSNSVVLTSLAKRFGISVIAHPTAKQLALTDAAVFFSAPQGEIILPEKCIVFGVNKEALKGVVSNLSVTSLTIELGNGKKLDVPHGFPSEGLIATALDAGTLKHEDIIIRDVKIADTMKT